MGDLAIRRMAAHEVDETVAVWARSRREALPWLEARLAHTAEDDRRFFRDVLMRECQLFVAVQRGAIVGLLALGEGRVEQLFVDPPCQARGIGSALLAHARTLSPGGLRLSTHRRNARARAFYERRGFRAVAFGTSPPPESEPDVEYAWTPPAGG